MSININSKNFDSALAMMVALHSVCKGRKASYYGINVLTEGEMELVVKRATCEAWANAAALTVSIVGNHAVIDIM